MGHLITLDWDGEGFPQNIQVAAPKMYLTLPPPPIL